jgi:hypothetical protein
MFHMKPPKKKKDKDAIFVAKMTKRSGAYVPNSTNTGITKAPKEIQKEHRATMKKTIKALKRGL